MADTEYNGNSFRKIRCGILANEMTVYIDATYGYIGSGPIHDLTVRIGDHRWIAATDYGDGADMTRSGVWVPQRSGGWWTAPTLDRALRDCPDPVIYRTRKAARGSPSSGQPSRQGR